MSSESESDDDYVPVEQEKLSEEESADEETEQQYDNEVETSNKKRKRSEPRKGNKRSKVIDQKSDDETTVPETNIAEPEEEKKREEDLWAQFLEGTDSKPKSKTEEIVTQPEKVHKNSIASKKSETCGSQSDKEREKRIFEFAGETIVVENNVIKERVKTAEKPASVLNVSPAPKARSSGGLSSIVGQLNKKNKLSTLEKSKLDWNTYKREEGIEEEITSHNKGKSGYLDRQDFLSRADVRQYEIERDLRMSRRSNR